MRKKLFTHNWTVLCILFVVCLFSITKAKPFIENIQYIELDSTPQTVTLPFLKKDAPNGKHSIRIVMDVPSFLRPTKYYVTVDDCLEAIRVNGIPIQGSNIPFCDFQRGRTIYLGEFLQKGENILEFDIQNNGWDTKFNIIPAFIDTKILLLRLLCIVLGIILFIQYIARYKPDLYSGLQKKWEYIWKYINANEIDRNKNLTIQQKTLGATVYTYMIFCILALGCIATSMALWQLCARIWYEMHGPFTADTTLYWTVGRGITNGLTPYIDLFENKPPGIFILSAFSVWLTGSYILTHVVQSIAILCIALPFSYQWYTTKTNRTKKNPQWWLTLLLLLSIGILLALYSAERSGEVQVESFGAAFGILFIWFTGFQRTWSKKNMWIAGLLLAGSIGFKEPFVLSVVSGASMLVIVGSLSWKERILIPICITCGVGIMLLLLTGYMEGYMTVYLTEMIGTHIGTTSSLWRRIFNTHKLVTDIIAYNNLLPWTLICIVLAGAFSMYVRKLSKKICLQIAGTLLVGWYCTAASVGIGGAYYNHHFVFAVPLYAACIFLLLSAERLLLERLLFPIVAICSIAVFATIFSQPSMNYSGRIDHMKNWSSEAMRIADVIDQVLDACNQDRYLFIGSNGSHPYADTKHSPLGPLFFQYDYYFNEQRPWMNTAWDTMLENANIVTLHTDWNVGSKNEYTKDVLAKNFTERPWACANGFDLSSRYYTFLFRKQ